MTINGRSATAMFVQELVTDLWVIRDGVTLFRGRVMSAEDDIAEVNYPLPVKAKDYRGVLERRLLPVATTWTGIEQATIAWALIAYAQAQTGGNLGITQGLWPATGVLQTVTANEGDNIWDVLAKVAGLDDGFDIDIDPSRVANLYYPRRGEDRGIILEYGGMVARAHRIFDPTQYANFIRHTGADGLGAVTRTVTDIASAPEGRWEAHLQDIQLTTTQMLGAAATAALTKYSRLSPTYEIQLAPGRWMGPDHIWLGDWVTVLVRVGRLNDVLQLRVHDMQIVLDGSGVETVTITCGDPRVDARSVLRGIQKRVQQLMKRG